MPKDRIKEESDLLHHAEVEDSRMSSSENQLHHHTITNEPHKGIQIKEEPDYIKQEEEQLHEVPFCSIVVKSEESFLLDQKPTEEINAKYNEESKPYSLQEPLESETSAATENSSDTDREDDSNSRPQAKKSSEKCRKTKINGEKCIVEAQKEDLVGGVSENARSFSKQREKTAVKNAEENQKGDLPLRDAKTSECTECGKTFRYNSDLKRHMTAHSGKRPFSCTVCNKTFTRKVHLTSHTFLHTGEKPFSCPVCKIGFADKRTLVKHMGAHPKESAFSCLVCKERFKDRESLKTHKRKHKESKLFCSECGTAFRRNQHLARHMKIHSGERPYNCTVCKRVFLRKDHLNLHMKTHVCSICKKCFTHRSTMKAHMKRYHSAVQT